MWGCRGSRSFLPVRSRVGNSTSCYSLRHGDRLFVFDGGRGLVALGDALENVPRFAGIRHVEVLISHAHCDHWEGLKDVGWFWRRGNGLHVTLHATGQALAAIDEGFAHPAYVPLDILSQGTVGSLWRSPLAAGDRRSGPGWVVEAFALNHASGAADQKRTLDTVGYRLEIEKGPVVCYLLDHEPAPHTLDTELRMLDGAHLAVYDAHFSTIREQMYGHGSQEHAATMARHHPGLVVLAGHHGPMYTDKQLEENLALHGKGLPGLRLAVEGHRYDWNRRKKRFETRSRGRAAVAAAASAVRRRA